MSDPTDTALSDERLVLVAAPHPGACHGCALRNRPVGEIRCSDVECHRGVFMTPVKALHYNLTGEWTDE